MTVDDIIQKMRIGEISSKYQDGAIASYFMEGDTPVIISYCGDVDKLFSNYKYLTCQ